MQFKNQWFGEALATPAYPLDSRGETIFEGLGGPRSWIEGSSFGADADTASADLIGSPHEGATRESTTPPEIRPEVVSAPQVPSLRSQYVIGLLGICLVFVPMLEALGTHINLGLPLRIGGIFTVALAVAAAVQIEEWVMCAQVALGLGLFGLGCFGPTDAIVDIFFCCVFGFLIAFIAGMQAENFKAARACRHDFEETDKFVRQLRFLRRGRCVQRRIGSTSSVNPMGDAASPLRRASALSSPTVKASGKAERSTREAKK